MNLYCANSGSKRISTAQILAPNKSLLRRLGGLQTNLYCADSGSKWTSTAQTRAPNEPLLRRLGLQTNLYCADSGSKWTSTAQTRAPNEPLLRRLGLQTNLYCANSGYKQISTAQTLATNESLLRRLRLQTNLYCADWAPNDVIYSRWQRPYWDLFASLFYSRRKQRRIVHLCLQSMVRVHLYMFLITSYINIDWRSSLVHWVRLHFLQNQTAPQTRFSMGFLGLIFCSILMHIQV